MTLRRVLERWSFTCVGALLALAFIRWTTGLYHAWLAIVAILVTSLLISTWQEWVLDRHRRRRR